MQASGTTLPIVYDQNGHLPIIRGLLIPGCTEPGVTYCSFDWMKQHAAQSVPLGGAFWDGGAEVFINKGVNGRWRDTLTPEESAEYEARCERELGDDCARWLASGAP